MEAQGVAQSVPAMIRPHEAAIDQLIASDARIQRRGFTKAVRSLAIELDDSEDDEEPYVLEDPLDFPPMDFRPDAFAIDRERERIVLYEVEVTHHLTERKLDAIARFWFWFDCEGEHDWWPELRLYNGEGLLVGTPDLCEAYWNMVDRRVRSEQLATYA